ncbi:ctns-1 [Pristionchus pacificus]|nr:ctns-1 [Pristionchus pacificus]|eukprot:PDM84873.1 ctns-1 [Pristionchus pacificus]
MNERVEDVLSVTFKTSEYILFSPVLTISSNESSYLEVTAGNDPINQVYLEIESCFINGTSIDYPLDNSSSFARIRIIRSHPLDVIVDIVGWAYFLAWSISFWPQIILNFQRKSVIGLNFDFVLLNTIGFASYTVYNCLLFFDSEVQSEYISSFPRSPIPVLLNDVVFAAHAFLACAITGIQVFSSIPVLPSHPPLPQAIFLERENQRVSRVCIGWSTILVLSGVVTLILTLTNVIQLLTFVDSLSYIKMGVTLSKYFPQAIMNFRRKSTVGWSIGNILLDFTGGTLDLLQVALQGVNVANFSAIIGNPVKFGLGFVSIVFDIVFMIQHYILYKDAQIVGEYEEIEEEGERPSSPSIQGVDNNIDNDESQA